MSQLMDELNDACSRYLMVYVCMCDRVVVNDTQKKSR